MYQKVKLLAILTVFLSSYTLFAQGFDWQGFSKSIDGEVKAVIEINGDYYIGGNFTTVGIPNTKSIARWDGSNWHSVGNLALNGEVTAFAKTDFDELIVAGSFSDIGGPKGDRLLKLGADGWEHMGSGLSNGYIKDLMIDGNLLYIAGVSLQPFFGSYRPVYVYDLSTEIYTEFQSAGIILQNGEVNAIAKDSSGNIYLGCSYNRCYYYSGSGIHSYFLVTNGSGYTDLSFGSAGPVDAVYLDDSNNVFVGGRFSSAGSTANTSKIAMHNGSSWQSIASGVTQGNVTNISALSGGDLLITGDISEIDGVAVNDLVLYSSGSISSFGTGLGSEHSGGIADVFVATTGEIIIGGNFRNALTPATTDFVSFYNGSYFEQITPLNLFNGSVNEFIKKDDGTIFVAGNFTNFGGDPDADYLLKYDGENWMPIATGLTGPLSDLEICNGMLYVAGHFSGIDGNNINHIAEYDCDLGIWNELGSGLTGYGVNALACDQGQNLYVGGSFYDAGGISGADILALWDGVSWSELSLGNSVSGQINSLTLGDDTLFIGGGNLGVSGITSISGQTILSYNLMTLDYGILGSGTSGYTYELEYAHNGLYASGYFSELNGASGPYSGLMFWNGTDWEELGTGLNGRVNDITTGPDDKLYVGGSFTADGNSNLATYSPGLGWEPIEDSIHNCNYSGSISGEGVTSIGFCEDTMFVGANFSGVSGSCDIEYFGFYSPKEDVTPAPPSIPDTDLADCREKSNLPASFSLDGNSAILAAQVKNSIKAYKRALQAGVCNQSLKNKSIRKSLNEANNLYKHLWEIAWIETPEVTYDCGVLSAPSYCDEVSMVSAKEEARTVGKSLKRLTMKTLKKNNRCALRTKIGRQVRKTAKNAYTKMLVTIASLPDQELTCSEH